MDVAKGSAFEPMLTTAVLAAREDFRLGNAAISPSTRTITGPGGKADVEPRVMQVLVLLADAAGHVVTRDTLFSRCWGSAYVGDDSLNRAVGVVRKLAGDIAAGSFEIETISRTGYRLNVLDGARPRGDVSDSDAQARPTRRMVVGGGVAAAAMLGGAGLWVARSREDREFDDLMRRGEEALDTADPAVNPIETFRRAVAMRPGNAKAQGLLAYASAMGSAYGETSQVGAAVEDAERAANAALALDPDEPNAQVAMSLLQRSVLDFAASEDRLRAVLASAPDNMPAMRQLWGLLQSTGRSRESLALIEHAMALKPLAAANHYPKAQLLWILGRNAEADRVIDRAMQYWPAHRFVRFARFTIFAFTGRPHAAVAMLDNNQAPQNYSPEAIALWRVSLAALDQRMPATIAAARKANLEAAKQDGKLTSQAVLALSALGEVDAAFEIANDLLLFRAPAQAQAQVSVKRPTVTGKSWRFAPWLFTPPIAAMRADRRFDALSDGIGLTEYWAKRGVKPDYQLGIT